MRVMGGEGKFSKVGDEDRELYRIRRKKVWPGREVGRLKGCL